MFSALAVRSARLSMIAVLLTLLLATPKAALADPQGQVILDVRQFQIIPRESGKTNYYSVVDDPTGPFIRGRYEPGYETAVLGIQVPETERQTARYLSWKWRAIALPLGGSECISGRTDSAASVYVTWKRGLRWYSVRYVWTTLDPVGSVCHRIRSPFVAQDSVVLESGPPLNRWVTETVDLQADFRRYLKDGDMSAEVPDLIGIGLMNDGDETHSESAGDFADFVLRP